MSVQVRLRDKETDDTLPLSSYRSPRGREQLHCTTKIWEAGRATSAASSFLEDMVDLDKPSYYCHSG